MNTFVLLPAVALLALMAGSTARAEPPVNQYLPPDQLYGPPGVQQRPPPPQFGGSPAQGGQFGGPGGASNQYLPPNQQYGAPGGGAAGSVGGGYGGSGGGYGGGYDDGSNGEPAKYEFEYMVNDPPSGNDFGHKESRDGDLTRGIYYVLLPDGRRQMVEYEADRDGYRPKISYTQVGGGFGGGAAGGGYPGAAGAGGYPGAGGAGGYPAAGGPGGYPGGGAGGYRY